MKCNRRRKCATVEKGEGLYLEGMIQEVFTDEGAVIENRKA